MPTSLKKSHNRQNIIYFILPIDILLLPLRQNLSIMSTIIGRKQEVDQDVIYLHTNTLLNSTSPC